MKTVSRSDLSAKGNAGVIEYMEELSQGQGIVHPDVEERMYEMSNNLEGISLRRYKNSIVMKDNKSSSIVAVAFGTAYSLRVGSMYKQAIDSGAISIHLWSDGTTLDLIESFGHDWIVGTWKNDETDWIRSGNA